MTCSANGEELASSNSTYTMMDAERLIATASRASYVAAPTALQLYNLVMDPVLTPVGATFILVRSGLVQSGPVSTVKK